MCIDFSDPNKLIPAIVQDASTGQVLMLGYMNEAAFFQTQETKRVTFYSRKRRCLWVKGETSGHFLKVVRLSIDCDQDTVLVLAKPQGPTCHTGTVSCFPESAGPWQVLCQLASIIQQRQVDLPEDSYTASLFQAGISKIAQKVGEEGVETVVAALSENDERLKSEAADLIYHLLVLLSARSIPVDEVMTSLAQRFR